MSEKNNKLVKTIIDAATITGLAAGIGWTTKKVTKRILLLIPAAVR